MSKKETIPGIYMNIEWAPTIHELSNEQIGIITKNLYRLVEKQELIEMDDLSRHLFKLTFAPTQLHNIKSYQDKIQKNSNNGKLGGAPKGNQNARKLPKVEGNDPKQAKQPKDIVSNIDKERNIDKESNIVRESDNKANNQNNAMNNSNSILNNNNNNLVDVIEKQLHSKESVEEIKTNKELPKINYSSSTSPLPPGATPLGEFLKNK